MDCGVNFTKGVVIVVGDVVIEQRIHSVTSLDVCSHIENVINGRL